MHIKCICSVWLDAECFVLTIRNLECISHTRSFASVLPFRHFQPLRRYLRLDLAEETLFTDPGASHLVQVALYDLLDKYNNEKSTEVLVGEKRVVKKYSVKKLPPYLVFHIHRFKHNNFFLEKNNTLVSFPLQNLDMHPCRSFFFSSCFVF